MSLTETIPFGILLKQLRKHAGMSQRDLAAALNCSNSLISSLERAQRQPDLQTVITLFVPALGLQDDPVNAAHLIERAAAARGERPPASVTFQRALHIVIQEDVDEQREGLPSPPTNLIGRTAEVNHLCNRLTGHSGRLLTLVGPPGIGKTRLALAIAARLQLHFPDGAAFVPLAEISDAELMAFTIAVTLGGSDAGPKPPKTRLIDFLRRKTMLLVLDNCEQIRDAARLVAEMLAACGGLVVLATSRERLHLRAEQRYRVPPLELGLAVELFTQRAAAVDANFVLIERHRATVEAICQRLDGLPLALELCASQTDLLSPSQILAHLQDRQLDLLVDGAHDFPPRHRTLRHAIQSSYELLSKEERRLFRTLGVFISGFALQEMEAIFVDNQVDGRASENAQGVPGKPPGPLSTLHALIGKSLVRAETLPSGEQRFSLLEVIREFALEQLRIHDEERMQRTRHYAIYLQLARTADRQLRGPEATVWLARLEPEQDNIRAAMQWMLDEARYEESAWLLLAVGWYWFLCGHWYERVKWLGQLLPHRQVLATKLRLAILISLYAVARSMDGPRTVNQHKDEIMQLLEVCSNKLLHASFWHFVAAYSSDFSEAAAAWERAIQLAREASSDSGLGAEFCLFTERDFVLGSQLWAYAARLLDQGEIERTRLLSIESLALFRARGSRYEMADGLGNLGRLALLQGELAQAHSLLHEAVSLATTFNYQEMLGYLQPLLGIVTLYGGDATEARRLLEESLHLCLKLKERIFLARVCAYLAEVALWGGELEQCEQWLAQSLTHHADPHRIRGDQVERLLVFACLATAKGQYQRSANIFGLAEQVRHNIHYELFEPVRSIVDAALAKANEALGAEASAEAFVVGQHLSMDEAYATILAPTALVRNLADP